MRLAAHEVLAIFAEEVWASFPRAEVRSRRQPNHLILRLDIHVSGEVLTRSHDISLTELDRAVVPRVLACFQARKLVTSMEAFVSDNIYDATIGVPGDGQ